MGLTLILTDDVARGERLARHFAGTDHPVVHDLYGDAPAPSRSGLIISDVSALTSESIRRLRAALARSRGEGIPYLHLIHGNIGRGEIQATALGATRVLPASAATAMLIDAVASLNGDREGAAVADNPPNRVDEARAAFVAVFTAKTPPAKAAVAVGAEMVDRAIRESNIRDWLDMVARFDDVTHRHCLTVAGLAAAFAQALGLNDADAHHLIQGALLHDIGKAQISRDILNTPRPLTPEERLEIERHPALGHAMLLGGGYDALMLAVVRSHHEYLDGSGYPDGLHAAEIPDVVRLVTICDVFSALIEWRPYKAPKSAEQAFAIVKGMSSKLDADLVRAFGPVAASCAGPVLRAMA